MSLTNTVGKNPLKTEEDIKKATKSLFPENTDMVEKQCRLTFDIPQSQHTDFKIYCAKYRVEMMKTLQDMFTDWFNDQKANNRI